METADEVVDLEAEEGQWDVEFRIECRENRSEIFDGDAPNREIIDDQEMIIDGGEILNDASAECDKDKHNHKTAKASEKSIF
jgi:hypothetical protein